MKQSLLLIDHHSVLWSENNVQIYSPELREVAFFFWDNQNLSTFDLTTSSLRSLFWNKHSKIWKTQLSLYNNEVGNIN